MNAAHSVFLELAAASIDFDLSRGERTRLVAHLATCQSCGRLLSELRGDAAMVRALPTRALNTARSDQILGRVLRRQPTRASRRLLTLAAVLSLLLVGIAAVGSGLIEPRQVPVLPAPSSAVPSSRPSPAVGPSATHSAADFLVERLEADSLGTVSAVAATRERIVAVGGTGCTTGSDGPGPRCWTIIWTSEDGSKWTQVASSGATEIGDITAPGGPTPGIVDVAAGASGFVGVGYAVGRECTDEACLPVATVWTSSDGTEWSAWRGALGEAARPHAIAAHRSSWVIVGERYLADGPRATVWTSDDGVAWTAVEDGPEFDVGGYLDTGEGLLSGGMSDVAARNDGLVAAGKRCDPFGVTCQVAIWSSADARDWTPRHPLVAGDLRTVFGGPEGFVALGLLCDDASCADEASRAGGFRSLDGVAWERVDIDVPLANLGVRAGAAGPGFVAAVETQRGASLPLFASLDGRSWTSLTGPLEIQGALAFGAVAATTLLDGAVMIVGWVETGDPSGFASFAFRIIEGT